MKLAWATDIHLDHTKQEARDAFLGEIVASQADVLVLTGDLSGGHSTLQKWLDWLDRNLDIPVWFVLGNHDYYNGTMADVRKMVAGWVSQVDSNRHPDWRHWLWEGDGLYPTEHTAVIGVDGWYDAKFGKVDGSIVLNDFFYIHDLRPFHRADMLRPDSPLLTKLWELADEETRFLECQLDLALQHRDRILVVTHVPPFADAAWHEGSRSEVNFLPFFSSRVMGEMLVEKMEQHPEKEMLVLCGHTHSGGEYSPLTNLKVYTGGAVYGTPTLCGLIEI